jgi:IS5 family transposase
MVLNGQTYDKDTTNLYLELRQHLERQLEQVNVNTTVQEKHIRFPTDARLYNRMRERLVKEAKKAGIVLRQTYVRVGKQLLFQQSSSCFQKCAKASS